MEKERNVKLIEAWGIYEVGDFDTLKLYGEDIGTFFTHKNSAEYVAYILEKFWKTKFAVIKQFIPVEEELQYWVYGIEIYLGGDVYTSDGQVFSNKEDAFEYSPLYNYYKHHASYEEVDYMEDVDDTDFDVFSVLLYDYYINRMPISIIRKNFDLEKYQNDQITINVTDSK